jgi:hypothetical protein
VGTGYSAQQAMAATGGTQPYSWSVSDQPNGMAMNSSSGALYGTPTAAWVWQVILAHLWQLTLAHLWQLAGQGRGMEIRCAPGWSVAEARSTARASISPWSWSCLSRRFAGSGSCRRRFR